MTIKENSIRIAKDIIDEYRTRKLPYGKKDFLADREKKRFDFILENTEKEERNKVKSILVTCDADRIFPTYDRKISERLPIFINPKDFEQYDIEDQNRILSASKVLHNIISQFRTPFVVKILNLIYQGDGAKSIIEFIDENKSRVRGKFIFNEIVGRSREKFKGDSKKFDAVLIKLVQITKPEDTDNIDKLLDEGRVLVCKALVQRHLAYAKKLKKPLLSEDHVEKIEKSSHPDISRLYGVLKKIKEALTTSSTPSSS